MEQFVQKVAKKKEHLSEDTWFKRTIARRCVSKTESLGQYLDFQKQTLQKTEGSNLVKKNLLRFGHCPKGGGVHFNSKLFEAPLKKKGHFFWQKLFVGVQEPRRGVKAILTMSK